MSAFTLLVLLDQVLNPSTPTKDKQQEKDVSDVEKQREKDRKEEEAKFNNPGLKPNCPYGFFANVVGTGTREDPKRWVCKKSKGIGI